ncbi:MAG TPA: hypothetical protein VN442_13695 [Bryobacteraceae bacterium]|nr:hypothetical protein [Bryobacteraceae bacterium]
MALAFAPTGLYGQCYLRVTGSPTLSRSGGNQVSGGIKLKNDQPVIGNWVVYLTAYLDYRANSSSEWTRVTSVAAQPTSIYNGTTTGMAAYSADVSGTLELRGNGDYRVTYASHGICGGQDTDLAPNPTTPSNIVSVARPTITTNGIAGMWWLNGISDPTAGFYDTAQVVGNTGGYSGTLTYQIVSGSQKARLTCTQCNTTGVQATATTNVCAQDVEVKASLGGFYAASSVKLAVNTIKPAIRTTPKPPTGSTSAYNNGWRTVVNYNVRDVCDGPISIPMSVNESFGTRTPAGSQWMLPQPRSGLVIPFADEIAVWPTQPGTLQPTVPQVPLGNVEVDRIPFFARLGSQTSGTGLLVTSTDQIRYVDHGDHATNPQ